MQRAIDTTGTVCGNVVKTHAGVALRELIVFVSRARGAASSGSDVDILVVIEPATHTWGAAQNIMERKRLFAVPKAWCDVPLDLWVRTIDQFEEARANIGCVEHLAATRGCARYSHPSTRSPPAQRSADEIRRRTRVPIISSRTAGAGPRTAAF